MSGPEPGRGPGDGFWTVCPYCYYVYEYERIYRDCVVRCQNEGCRRGFEAVEVRVPPPEAVVKAGSYLCLGFRAIELVGVSSWTPFSPVIGEDREVKRRKAVAKCEKKVAGKGVRVRRDQWGFFDDGIFAGLDNGI